MFGLEEPLDIVDNNQQKFRLSLATNTVMNRKPLRQGQNKQTEQNTLRACIFPTTAFAFGILNLLHVP